MIVHYYLYKNDNTLDRESLEFFIERYWRDTILPLKVGEIYVRFSLEGEEVRDDPFKYRSDIMIIKNDEQSKELLTSKILCGPVGSLLNIHESIYFKECYFSSFNPKDLPYTI